MLFTKLTAKCNTFFRVQEHTQTSAGGAVCSSQTLDLFTITYCDSEKPRLLLHSLASYC